MHHVRLTYSKGLATTHFLRMSQTNLPRFPCTPSVASPTGGHSCGDSRMTLAHSSPNVNSTAYFMTLEPLSYPIIHLYTEKRLHTVPPYSHVVQPALQVALY